MAPSRGTEQRPALVPDRDGFVQRDGVRVHWEVYGEEHRATVLLLPTWVIVTARIWKAQLSYLARHFRVVTFDGRGNGRSDRPAGAMAYRNEEYVEDARAVLDATGTDRAVVVGLSCGVTWAVLLAATYADRVRALVAIGASCGVSAPQVERERTVWDSPAGPLTGGAKYNRRYWLEGGYDDFVATFFTEMFCEPHSTKQIEDAVEWAHQTTAQVIADSTAARLGCDGVVCAPVEEACRRVQCPVLAIHGTSDRICAPAISERLAQLTGARLVLLEGVGHGPVVRDPVQINRLIKSFVEQVIGPPVPEPAPYAVWTHASGRRRRVLYVSSPIGLGHARRDLAIASCMRDLGPDLQVDWLAQEPVAAVLASAGENVHPASQLLLSESGHIEYESGEHDLHAFQAIRRMDEILVSNFMVFHDLVDAEPYDLVVGDEAWDLDYFLHENPELKRFAYAWMTDFVGWLPMPDDDAATAAIVADYNAEMIEHRARFPRVRDRSVFVGNPTDVVTDRFGPGLPRIREWTQQNFDFSGYVTGFVPPDADARSRTRRRLGVRPDQRLCVVTVGGSGVGEHLLQRVLEAVPVVRHRLPDLHFLVVTGPRIDPSSLPRRRGVRIRGHVPRLYEHLAACDVAVVQGGLTTCMELTANRTPFLYVPLEHHFEQNIHVRYRLDRYDAGNHMCYADVCDPEQLADAICKTLEVGADFRPVETDGAARAAGMLAELL
jgi:pimeloyl-ACP methyl ester carboxylesterase/predicted glycosyltransferase